MKDKGYENTEEKNNDRMYLAYVLHPIVVSLILAAAKETLNSAYVLRSIIISSILAAVQGR